MYYACSRMPIECHQRYTKIRRENYERQIASTATTIITRVAAAAASTAATTTTTLPRRKPKVLRTTRKVKTKTESNPAGGNHKTHMLTGHRRNEHIFVILSIRHLVCCRHKCLEMRSNARYATKSSRQYRADHININGNSLASQTEACYTRSSSITLLAERNMPFVFPCSTDVRPPVRHISTCKVDGKHTAVRAVCCCCCCCSQRGAAATFDDCVLRLCCLGRTCIHRDLHRLGSARSHSAAKRTQGRADDSSRHAASATNTVCLSPRMLVVIWTLHIQDRCTVSVVFGARCVVCFSCAPLNFPPSDFGLTVNGRAVHFQHSANWRAIEQNC